MKQDNSRCCKVTIGICVKNSERTIRKAIESVLAQAFPQKYTELIIVDGYSQDKTVRIICSNLDGVDVKTRIFYENEGLGRARQIVVDNAHGEYIIWVDGDMILSRDFVGMQLEFMEQNPNVGIAKGRYGTYKDDKPESLVAALENIEFVLNTALEGVITSKALGASGCVYRVEAAKQAGNFDPQITGVGEDMDIEDRIRKAGWRLCITTALFYEIRRQTWGSLWKEYSWHGKGASDILRKDRHILSLYKMLPPIALFGELTRVPIAYKLTHQKIVLLLPLHYTFKRIAWFFGLFNAYLKRSLRK